MAFMFENLKVYKESADFADQICSKTENFTAVTGSLSTSLTGLHSPLRPTLPKATADSPKRTVVTSSVLRAGRFKTVFRS